MVAHHRLPDLAVRSGRPMLVVAVVHAGIDTAMCDDHEQCMYKAPVCDKDQEPFIGWGGAL